MRPIIITLTVLLLSPIAGLSAAETSTGHPASTLTAGTPTLDEMAGDWLALADVANPPDVHNFNQMVIVGRDLTSYYCYPGALFTHTKDPATQWRWGIRA